jgi:hypothetical protein
MGGFLYAFWRLVKGAGACKLWVVPGRIWELQKWIWIAGCMTFTTFRTDNNNSGFRSILLLLPDVFLGQYAYCARSGCESDEICS